MGGCSSKQGVKEAADPSRRRLTVNESAEAETGTSSTEERGNAKALPSCLTTLDHLPARGRKSSLCGAGSEYQQRGFTDKATEKAGEDDLTSFKIGYACKKGLKPESPNQDDFCIFHADNISIYGVFDGHGPYGHDISRFVQETLPARLVQDPHFKDDPEKALNAAFPETHRLCMNSQANCRFDCTLSGTTATLAMSRDGHLYVAHVGDSRAVLARKLGNKLQVEDLTVDHKPTCEAERSRIQSAGGQVKRLEGDIPHRVFLAGKMYPGLAMTRSIGDTVGTTAGVTSTPAVRVLEVKKDWRFILLCSDGIWEFISSQEAVDIVGRHPASEVQKAADTLASEAWNRWIKEESNVVDDITVICAWFYED